MYTKLYEAYKQCYGDLSKKKIQDEVNILWKQFKADKVNYPKNVETKVLELRSMASKKKGKLLSFFAKVSQFTKILRKSLCATNFTAGFDSIQIHYAHFH